jgi:hypothetical protein
VGVSPTDFAVLAQKIAPKVFNICRMIYNFVIVSTNSPEPSCSRPVFTPFSRVIQATNSYKITTGSYDF